MTEQGMEHPPASGEPPLVSLHGELVQLLARQARRVPLTIIAVSVLLALLVLPHVPAAYPGLWLALVCASTLVHARMISGLPADTSRTDDQKLTLAAWSFTLRGALLASVFVFFPFVSVTTAAMITIFSAGLCASTLPATAGFQRIYRPYALVTLAPPALAWGLSPSVPAAVYERFIFVGITAVFLVTMLGHAKGAFNVFTESYNIRLQQLDLNRRLRNALEQSDAASRAKTRFLASASHDLRQPIHALSLFSGSLLLRPLDARSAGIAAQIDKAVKVLSSQLDALLDISRLDAGVIQASVSAVDLQSLLDPLYDEFSVLAERKGLRLTFGRVAGLALRTDPLLFQQILRNLLSNAIKYTPAGRIELIVQPLPGAARLTLSDTGPGIPAGEHQRIFEEFYQLHNPERDRSKGLGLGLAIVRRLTELLAIELTLESEPGQGSRFSMEIPMATQHDLPTPQTAAPPSPLSQQIQVLVLDDEETIRLGMQTLLEEMGFGVCAVASTEEALASARQHPPSIVLADLRLRGADDGIRAVNALRGIRPGLPALLISGDTAPDRLRQAHAAGIELLHKPVGSTQLRESILHALHS